MNRMNATCRVALAGLVHDLGKFAERAGLEVTQAEKETAEQLYCPRKGPDQFHWHWTHVHAAYTALAFDVIEKAAPDLVKGDMTPFAGRSAGDDITDSLVNAAARHHAPETFLQWVIATADRLSSGFERESFELKGDGEKEKDDYLRARLHSLLEEVRLPEKGAGPRPQKGEFVYPLKPLSPAGIFPVSGNAAKPESREEARREYGALWEDFRNAVSPETKGAIPKSHRGNWPLWLDHFDTAWLTFTRNIPSASYGVVPNVSLYDHSKSTAAFAAALWRWHEENGKTGPEALAALKEGRDGKDWEEKKFLLIQGDFFGIQNFIFAEGSLTNKKSAKLLRGRSFYVSLVTELAALKILEALDLPPTSQITNAAGKFLILAPNTPETERRLKETEVELNRWFIENMFGVSGLGIAALPASCADFASKTPERNFSVLMKRLFESLDRVKMQRFDLLDLASPVLEADYSDGVSDFDGHLPSGSPLPDDQILLGARLVKDSRLLVLKDAKGLFSGTDRLRLPIFGYTVAFAKEEEEGGKFGDLARSGALRRCWDYALPDTEDAALWNGYARRNVNGYVPKFYGVKELEAARYADLPGAEELELDVTEPAFLKTFEHIACEDRDAEGTGKAALTVLKGDIDHLGLIFQNGLTNEKAGRYANFAKMAALSRQVNEFFSVYLPSLCSREFPNTYTVYAGGDDFFLIGPWHSVQRLAGAIHESFARYAANPEIHFSAGMIMVKPGVPLRTLAEMSEEALKAAKGAGRDRVTCLQQTMTWGEWQAMERIEGELVAVKDRFGLSAGYFYGLFGLLDMAGRTGDPEAQVWRSLLYYRTVRMATARAAAGQKAEERKFLTQDFLPELSGLIVQYGKKLRVPLSNLFYQLRK